MKPRGSGCLLLLLLLFVVSLVGHLSTSTQLTDTPGQNVTAATKKAGTCPKATMVTTGGNCPDECQSDADCEGTKKCCWTGCGASCHLPNDKPGFCPPDPPILSLLGFCKEECREDSECPRNRKCCMSGCKKRNCVPPRAEQVSRPCKWHCPCDRDISAMELSLCIMPNARWFFLKEIQK